MILNAAQQARLFALANGAQVEGVKANVAALQSLGGTTGGSKSVSLRLKGRDLVGVIANETRGNRRRSNIKL